MPDNKNFIHFTPGREPEPDQAAAGRLFVAGHAPQQGEIHVQVPREALHDLIQQKQAAITHVYKTLDAVHQDMRKGGFLQNVPEAMPGMIDGVLLNPDGTPARNVSVQALEPVYTREEQDANGALKDLRWAVPQDVTDARGGFRLNLSAAPLPLNGLSLRVMGGNGALEMQVRRVVLSEARLGNLVLLQALHPLSVVAQLKGIQSDILATSAKDVANQPGDFAAPAPQLTLGEGDCARYFRSNSGVIDQFRYSTLIRLIEPQMNQWTPIFRIGLEGDRFLPFVIPHVSDSFWNATGAENAIEQMQGLGRLTLVNRMPVERAIDVSAFHKLIEENPVYLPKASTLGLGYVVHMQQTWIPAGLSLGDLIYSLPLAPGEQQRIAIEERAVTATDRTLETYSQEEFQSYRETQDSSAVAVFRSAFDEAARGGSHLDSESHTGSVAAEASTGIVGAIFGGGGVSGGYSSSASSGNTNSWQNTSRDFTSNAAQDMHSALNRVAAGSRRGAQTRVRVATESERTQVTTRVVTNHNKGHALTMQWWQVLRHFNVSSEVDDVELVCFVPFELVAFLPKGLPFSLDGMPAQRQDLLNRYAMVLRYYDVIYPFFRRNPEYAYGMRALRDFAANPEAKPELSLNQASTVHFSITGTFFPIEEVSVTVVTKSGARLGPIGLASGAPIKTVDLKPEVYSSRADLVGRLASARGLGLFGGGNTATLSAIIALPDWLARTDIVRFDVQRRFLPMSYKLKLPALTLNTLGDYINAEQHQTVSLTPSELEQEVGGPVTNGGKASLEPGTIDLIAPQAVSSFFWERMPGLLPLPALRIAPVLLFGDLLRIETVFHHIVRNTVFYSKAVWASLSAEERAILLERFTIGVPPGGVQGPDQEVPLLNCVANRVLGFFGNAAIMPFGIPPEVARTMEVTSRDIQDALLKFHRQAFQQPRSSITLPARGTLGEAVLGCCNSAEKIDLTRFWNCQDSPTEQADAIPASAFQPAAPIAASGGGGSASGGSGAAGGAGSSGSIISVNSGPPAPASTALIEALIKQSPDLAKELNLAGLDALQKQIAADTQSAGTGRDKAIDANTQIQLQAMKSAESIVKSVADAAGKAAPAAAGGV